MKKSKKILCVIMAFMLILCTACTTAQSNVDVIHEQGTKLVKMMQEMPQSEYLINYTNTEDWSDLLQSVTDGNYDQPKAVYRLKIDTQYIAQILNVSDFDNMSPELQEVWYGKACASVSSVINNKAGTDAVVVATLCSVQITFLGKALNDNEICLFVYEDAPAAIVSFVVGGDHAVCANGSFIFDNNLDTTDITTVQSYFTHMSTQVEVLEKQS